MIHNIIIGPYSQNTSSEFVRDCSVIYVDDVISAMCFYSGVPSVTGFQMFVQLNNVADVHKLLINSTTEHLSPGRVTVQVNKSGTYHVTIFPIRIDMGIADTIIAHSQELSRQEYYGRRNIIITHEIWLFLRHFIFSNLKNIYIH